MLECVSHETLRCINAASSFWPRCDPSQSKVDNFPTLHDRTPSGYGHFCTKEWADALNVMLSDTDVNKCGDRNAQIKWLAQIAVETGYFTTLFQPADGGAGLVHMIPNNWPINAEDMEALFGGDFVARQAASGASFFQSPIDGWLSVAAWYKRTNRVIPSCGKDLFDEVFDVQTRCIFGRPNNRMEAFDIVSQCFGAVGTTVGPIGGSCSGAPCADVALCRSKFGHCGSTSDHCNAESTWKVGGCRPDLSSTSTPTKVTASTTSAPSKSSGDVVTTTTKDGDGDNTCRGVPCQDVSLCRSKLGFCGSSPQHCNIEFTWKADGCGLARVTSTISTSSSSFLALSSTTSLHLSFTTSASTANSNDGTCSGTSCLDVTQCRSRWGFCGSTSQYCNAASSWKASGCRPAGTSSCPGEPCSSLALCRSEFGFCGSSPQHCNQESTWKANGCTQVQFTAFALNDTSISFANDSLVCLSRASGGLVTDVEIIFISIAMLFG